MPFAGIERSALAIPAHGIAHSCTTEAVRAFAVVMEVAVAKGVAGERGVALDGDEASSGVACEDAAITRAEARGGSCITHAPFSPMACVGASQKVEESVIDCCCVGAEAVCTIAGTRTAAVVLASLLGGEIKSACDGATLHHTGVDASPTTLSPT